MKNAEQYYRSMFRGHTLSWNLRDGHMAETLDALVDHLDQQGPRAKIVVWERNSHLGDARATESGESGQLNVGQLMRERYGREAVIVGFTTYTGTVTAASDWDAPAERNLVRPALPQSYEWLFHQTPLPSFLLVTRENEKLKKSVRSSRRRNPPELFKRAGGWKLARTYREEQGELRAVALSPRHRSSNSRLGPAILLGSLRCSLALLFSVHVCHRFSFLSSH